MPRFRPYPAPEGAIHDLAHWEAIDPNACSVLMVSHRTLYLLQNLVALDIEFVARYASELREDGYYIPLEGEPGWSVYRQAVELAQAEVVDMTCDISSDLQAILDAMGTQGELLSTLFSELEAILGEMPTHQDIVVQSAGSRDQALCCGPAGDLDYYDSQPGDTGNPETSAFCDMCWSLAKNWSEAAVSILDTWLALEMIGIGLLAIITGLLELPLVIILGIIELISGVALEVSKDDLLAVPGDLVGDIACAIYSSSNPAAAKTAVDSVLADATYPLLWPVAATYVLQYLIGYNALNQVFAETYTIRADSAGSDCGSCAPVGTGLLETTHGIPYDVLLVGDDVTDFDYQDPSYGWKRYNPGTVVPIHFYFTPDEDVNVLHIEFDIWTTFTAEAYRPIITVDNTDTARLWDAGWLDGTNQEWQHKVYEVTLTNTMENGVQHALRFDLWYHREMRIRNIYMLKIS